MLVQDLNSGKLGTVSDADLDATTATQFDVYIGNSPNYLENTKCTETPCLSANYQDILKEWTSDGN